MRPPRDYADALEDFWRAAEAMTDDVIAARHRKTRVICLTVVVGLAIIGGAVWLVVG